MVVRTGALFAGTRTFGILCSIIKTKLVALWLDAAGVGLFGIFNTTVDTAVALTGMQLRQSAVGEVARASSTPMLARVASVVRLLALHLGLIGGVLLAACAWWLSEAVFQTGAYWWQFALLGACVMLNSVASGEEALLQGARRLKAIARSSVVAAVIGLAVSVPMFRFLGDKSVVLSLLAYSVAAVGCLIYWRLRTPRERIPASMVWREGSGMLRFGVAMSVAAFATSAASLLFLSWLNRRATTVEVGYYQAAYTLMVRYMGIIFVALSMEYYPRLAACVGSPRRTQTFVGHEIVLLMRALAPMAVVFLLARPLIVRLLYTQQFLVVIPMLGWAVQACAFRGLSFALAYTVLARGDGRIYIFTEIASAALGLALNVWLYSCMGLIGLGIAYAAQYAVYAAMMWGVYRFRYGLHLQRGALLWTFLTAAATLTVLLIE